MGKRGCFAGLGSLASGGCGRLTGMSSFLYRLPRPRGEGERETGGLCPLPACFSRRGESSKSGGEREGKRRLIASCLCLGGDRSRDGDLLRRPCRRRGSRDDERLLDMLRLFCLRLKGGGEEEGDRPRIAEDLPRLGGDDDQLLDLEPSRDESRRATCREVEGGRDTDRDRLWCRGGERERVLRSLCGCGPGEGRLLGDWGCSA